MTFCLAVSHMILITVSDTFDNQIDKLFGLCLDCLKDLKANKIPLPRIMIIENKK